MLLWFGSGDGGLEGTGLPPSNVSDPDDCAALSKEASLLASIGLLRSQSSPLLLEWLLSERVLSQPFLSELLRLEFLKPPDQSLDFWLEAFFWSLWWLLLLEIMAVSGKNSGCTALNYVCHIW